MRYYYLAIMLCFLGGCDKYEISYIGSTHIIRQEIKPPDVGPPGQYDSIVEDNVAFHFTLDNIEFDDLTFNEFLGLNLFICGQEKFETNLHSALYFPTELIFADKQNEPKTENSFYGVFVPRMLADMKENAAMQDKSICARVMYHYPYELKKTSNTVKLGKLE